MKTLKKALSVMLCAVMMLTVGFVFPVIQAAASEVSDGDSVLLCNYDEIDRLEGILAEVLGGEYDNQTQITLNRDLIEKANGLIEDFSTDRDVREASEQALIDAACDIICQAIASIYTAEDAAIEIRGDKECYAGNFVNVKAYLMPVDVEITDGVWTSSDNTTGFFTNGKFFAAKTGEVTLTVYKNNLSADVTITVKGGTGARVVMFDTLLSQANYIVEGSLVIKETTNLFWAPDAPVHFRVITDGTFEEYLVYINKEVVTPDETGTYTIPENSGDAHVKIEGVVKNEEGNKISIWEAIADFFRKIAEFFRNLFSL